MSDKYQPESDTDTVVRKIDERTALPLKMVIPLVATIVSATLMIVVKLNSMETKIISMEQKINSIWTRESMEIWSLHLGRKNPTLQVPDIVR